MELFGCKESRGEEQIGAEKEEERVALEPGLGPEQVGPEERNPHH